MTQPLEPQRMRMIIRWPGTNVTQVVTHWFDRDRLRADVMAGTVGEPDSYFSETPTA